MIRVFLVASLLVSSLSVNAQSDSTKVHAFFAYNQNAANVYKSTFYEGGSQPYKTMQTVWYHYDIPKFPLGVSLLFMNTGMQAGVYGDKEKIPSTVYQQLYGGYLNFHPKYLTF